VLAKLFSWEPLVAVGASTYALYLLHFNVYILLHEYHVLDKLHLARFDPWISYVFVILLAVAVRKWVEHPAQQVIGRWWKRREAAKVEPAAIAVS
jgi:peptidoglycan/LPS O-acetylase OafA/YrhL